MERLTAKQLEVLGKIGRGVDAYNGVVYDRNAIIGRSNTLQSLWRRGFTRRFKQGPWELTDKGKAALTSTL